MAFGYKDGYYYNIDRIVSEPTAPSIETPAPVQKDIEELLSADLNKVKAYANKALSAVRVTLDDLVD